MNLPFSRFRPQFLQVVQAGEIGRTPFELDALLLLALPLLFTLQAFVAEFTERSHQLARIRFTRKLYGHGVAFFSSSRRSIFSRNT